MNTSMHDTLPLAHCAEHVKHEAAGRGARVDGVRNGSDARPQLVMPPDEGALFLTQEGESLSPNRLTQLVRDYVNAAEVGKTGACHLWRHTCATLMLEGGADIRYIQEMLGHVELSTTQIYTQVSIRRLKAVHALTHPSAKMDRPTKSTTTTANGTSDETAEDHPPLVAYREPDDAGCARRKRRAEHDGPAGGARCGSRRRTRG